MGKVCAWAVVAALSATPCLAAGPDAVPYPADPTSQSQVQAWMARYLPARGYVVGAWSPNVVMLVSTRQMQSDTYPVVAAQVMSQVLNPDAAKAAGWRAAVAQQEFACDRNQYRTLSTLYFQRADQLGDFDPDVGDETWISPEPGTTMETVARAACFFGARKQTAALAKTKPITRAAAKTKPKAKPTDPAAKTALKPVLLTR